MHNLNFLPKVLRQLNLKGFFNHHLKRLKKFNQTIIDNLDIVWQILNKILKFQYSLLSKGNMVCNQVKYYEQYIQLYQSCLLFLYKPCILYFFNNIFSYLNIILINNLPYKQDIVLIIISYMYLNKSIILNESSFRIHKYIIHLLNF